MPSPLSFHDTLHRHSVPFQPINPEEVKVYTCGITPYNYAHIGNYRAYVFEDIVVRTLKYLGYGVKRVMNVTDIDDKTIRDSQKHGKTLTELTEFYTGAFLEDLSLLRCEMPDILAPISGLVPEMIAMIQTLLDKGIAYVADDGVYYSVEKFAEYGKLAHLDRAGMTHSVRIKNDEYEKDAVADFALWKAWDEADGPNKWEADFIVNGEKVSLPWRPGWHIECSACNMKYFGEEIDIHMGGIDNIFPHHENEIAQTEACTGHTFSRYWLHTGHLMVDGKKMAKSAGNFYTLRDVFARFEGMPLDKVARAFRLICLQARYSDSVNFTWDKVEAALSTLESIDAVIRRVARLSVDASDYKIGNDELVVNEITLLKFTAALSDDFNTSEALSVYFGVITEINSRLSAHESGTKLLGSHYRNQVQEFFRITESVFAIADLSLFDGEHLPEAIKNLLAERDEAKKGKDFSRADTLRKEIEQAGWRVVDTKEGGRAERV